jgi:chaperonin cofactor prefoldin
MAGVVGLVGAACTSGTGGILPGSVTTATTAPTNVSSALVGNLEQQVAALEQRIRELEEGMARLGEENEALETELEAQRSQREEIERQLTELNDSLCAGFETDPPETVGDQLASWVEESHQREIPEGEDLEVTVVDAVGSEGIWVLVADFSSRFERGVFATQGEDGFQVLWGGIASTEAEIRQYMATERPELAPLPLLCVDVSSFVEN